MGIFSRKKDSAMVEELRNLQTILLGLCGGDETKIRHVNSFLTFLSENWVFLSVDTINRSHAQANMAYPEAAEEWEGRHDFRLDERNRKLPNLIRTFNEYVTELNRDGLFSSKNSPNVRAASRFIEGIRRGLEKR